MKFEQKERQSIRKFINQENIIIYNLNKEQLKLCIHIIKEEDYIEGANFCNKESATGIKLYGQNCYAFFRGNPYNNGLAGPSNNHIISYSDFVRKFG